MEWGENCKGCIIDFSKTPQVIFWEKPVTMDLIEAAVTIIRDCWARNPRMDDSSHLTGELVQAAQQYLLDQFKGCYCDLVSPPPFPSASPDTSSLSSSPASSLSLPSSSPPILSPSSPPNDSTDYRMMTNG